MTRRHFPLLIALFGLAAAACHRSEAAQAQPPAAAAQGIPRLVFFMNPNGRPCQIQDGILRGMAGDLQGKVQVVYYRTTSDQDLALFEQYGIRSLPSLVLTDAAGRELRRATPGIQPEDAIRSLIGG